MKISTSLFYQRATQQITTAQTRLGEAQAQLASGKQLVGPSDAPEQALGIERIRSAIQHQEGISDRLAVADSRLKSEESGLKSVSTMLIRFKELALRGIDDSLNAKDRLSVAKEMGVLREQMLSVANGRDGQGLFLFGGSSVSEAPFVQGADGRVTYRGDQTEGWAMGDRSRVVEFNRAGSDAFPRLIREDGGTPTGIGFFDVLDDVTAAVSGSDKVGMTRGLTELDGLMTGNGLAIVQVGSDQNAIDNQVSIVEESVLSLKTTLSDLEDLDYAEAITRMNQKMMAMEAAMSSFSKVSGLSLFNFIDP